MDEAAMDVVEETSLSSESTEKQKSNIRFYENITRQ